MLAGCSASIQSLASGPTITGTPTLNINSSLASASCTTASCIAISTSQFGSRAVNGPTAELYSTSTKSWTQFNVPFEPQQISSSSCWSQGCLISGSSIELSFLWKYSAGIVTQLTLPADYQAATALSCFSNEQCALIGYNKSISALGISFSQDTGVSWSTPTALPSSYSPIGAISLSCTDASNCLVSATHQSSNTALLYATHDGGVTWVKRNISNTWSQLQSLSCINLKCVGALTDSSGNNFVVRSKTFGRIWRKISTSNSGISNMSCSGISNCVIIGTNKMGEPWIETLHNDSLVVNKVAYFSTPLNSVSCYATTCVVVGNTAVAAVPLSS